MIDCDWAQIKSFVTDRAISIQYIDMGDRYILVAMDGYFSLTTTIKKQEEQSEDQIDFETNFKSFGNQTPSSLVTTQYEKNDKDLRLTKIKFNIENGVGEARLKVPGNFGDNNDGRWIAGGDGWLHNFDPDDYLTVCCSDDDRLIALAYGGLTDEQMRGIDFPDYPILKYYTDTDYGVENQGWYFWALAQGSNLPPLGEIEFEPIAGYGHIPAAMYLVITVKRLSVDSGVFRANLFWGKKG